MFVIWIIDDNHCPLPFPVTISALGLQAMQNQLIEKQFRRNLPVFLLQDQVVQSPSRLLYNYSPTTAVLKVRNNQKAKHEALAEILHLTFSFVTTM